jgi:hypothetical protein
MSVPAVKINEVDGALGIVPSNQITLHAFMGCSTAGPLNTPVMFARATDVTGTFGEGPLVEAAALYITQTGNACLLVRVDDVTAPAVGTVVQVGLGAAATAGPATAAFDDRQVVIKVVSGGVVVATAGNTYQVSEDGGQTWGPVTALGTSATVTVAGVVFTFAAAPAKLETGTTYAATITAPNWDATTLPPALEALRTTTQPWEQLFVIGPLTTAAVAAVIDTAFVGFAESPGKDCSWIAQARMPNDGESETVYAAALQTALGGVVTSYGTICAAACRVPSGVSGRFYRRSPIFPVASAQSCYPEINTADVNRGALVGVSIRDANGNVVEHDEAVNPTLDAQRFLALRTVEGYGGVYINRPLLFSQIGSDFELIPHRRVMNMGKRTLRTYFVRRLNRPVRIDKATGYILEADALEIEGGANAALRSALMSRPSASDVKFTLSRTDNLLSTKTLTGTCRIVPLAYPEFIEIQIGFYNPALVTLAAAA